MAVSENLVCLLGSGCGDVAVAEGSGSFEGFAAAATGPAHHQLCLFLVSLLLAHSMTRGGHMKALGYLCGYRWGGTWEGPAPSRAGSTLQTPAPRHRAACIGEGIMAGLGKPQGRDRRIWSHHNISG